MQPRPDIGEEDPTVLKRAKRSGISTTGRAEGSKKGSLKQKTPKEKREEKRSFKGQHQNNKGLIGAATMLSVVGMLNYMGQGEVPNC